MSAAVDPVPPAARDVDVLRRVLPLPDRHHGGRAGDARGRRGCAGAAARRSATGRWRAPRTRRASRRAAAAGSPGTPRPMSSRVTGRCSRAASTSQIRSGTWPRGPLALQPPCDGGVFVSAARARGARARLVDVRGESRRARSPPRPGSRRAGCWAAWVPPGGVGARQRSVAGLHTGCERSTRIRSVRALSRRVPGRLTEARPRKRRAGPLGSPSHSAAARTCAVRVSS